MRARPHHQARSERNRAGEYIEQSGGYCSFRPVPLAPVPELIFDVEMMKLLSKADRALGRLDGATEILPNPDLFVFGYIRKEAVLSSQIEGTQSSLLDLLEYEARAVLDDRDSDVVEVANYVCALNYGIQALEKGRPLSITLLRELHEILLRDVRGSEWSPGMVRNVQNWIGPPGCRITNALFIPPAVNDMMVALDDLEVFLQSSSEHLTPLLMIGLAHAQFETSHPFLDGNGRIGRLLITLLLIIHGLLKRPILYISHYFLKHRAIYYDRLQAIRDEGQWEQWLKFFLEGIFEVAEQAAFLAQCIVGLRERHRKMIIERFERGTAAALATHDLLFEKPILSVNRVRDHLGVTYPVANRLILALERHGIVKELTGQKRNRRFEYSEYLDLLME